MLPPRAFTTAAVRFVMALINVTTCCGMFSQLPQWHLSAPVRFVGLDGDLEYASLARPINSL